MLGAAVALAACAEVDDTTGSRLQQPPAGTPPPKPTPAGDITIVGQEMGHAIIDLPEVANAAVPPLVQFTGVTSIIASPVPIETQPYTVLLRDRLLLITRLKLRFVERTLPPLSVAPAKGKKKSVPAAPVQNTTNPDYQILAELRGRYDADLYKIQVEFVDLHTGDVLINNLYSIRKEAEPAGQPADASGDDTSYEHLPPPPEAGGAPVPAPEPPAANPTGVQ